MSWHFEVGPVEPERFGHVADEALAAANIELCNPAGVEPAKAALDALKSLVEHVSAPGNGKRVQASACGHANPGRCARDGWANDSITVQVWQEHVVPTGG